MCACYKEFGFATRPVADKTNKNSSAIFLELGYHNFYIGSIFVLALTYSFIHDLLDMPADHDNFYY